MEMSNIKFKLIIAVLAMATAIFACRKNEPDPLPVKSSGSGTVPTKSLLALRAAAATESISVWVFTSSDSAYCASAGEGLTMQCAAEHADIFVAGNLAKAPYGGNWHRPDTVTADISRMTASRITCSGSVSATLTPGTNEIPVETRRCISKISLGKIENQIEEGAYAHKSVTIEKVQLVNGIGRYRIFDPHGGRRMPYPSSGRWWYSVSGVEEGAGPSLMATGEGIMAAPPLSYSTTKRTIAYGSTETLDIELFTGPNSIEDDAFSSPQEVIENGNWQPRKTRLVVQCSIDGKRCYYPVTIDDIRANYRYYIRKLVITRFGADWPDQPYDYGSGELKLSLTTWDGVTLHEVI